MMSVPAKKYLGILLEVAVTAAALYFVFHDPAKRAQMADACRQADWRWLAAGVAVYGVVEALAVVRWQILLRLQGFRLGWGRATAILFIGEFFLTFTPGLVGGDAMRVLFLVRDRPDKKAEAFTTVLMDRIMGMLSLICLATYIVGTRWSWLCRSPVAAWWIKIVILILGAGVAALIAGLSLAAVGTPSSWRIAQWFRELARAFRQFGKDWRGTAGAFATTLVSHFCYYSSFCCAALALGHFDHPERTFGDVFAIMPIENTLTSLPISFAGIGLRESILQTLLHDLSGVPTAIGALIGSAGFGMKVLWSLPGAFVFLTYRLVGRSPEPSTTESPQVQSG